MLLLQMMNSTLSCNWYAMISLRVMHCYKRGKTCNIISHSTKKKNNVFKVELTIFTYHRDVISVLYIGDVCIYTVQCKVLATFF